MAEGPRTDDEWRIEIMSITADINTELRFPSRSRNVFEQVKGRFTEERPELFQTARIEFDEVMRLAFGTFNECCGCSSGYCETVTR